MVRVYISFVNGSEITVVVIVPISKVRSTTSSLIGTKKVHCNWLQICGPAENKVNESIFTATYSGIITSKTVLVRVIYLKVPITAALNTSMSFLLITIFSAHVAME